MSVLEPYDLWIFSQPKASAVGFYRMCSVASCGYRLETVEKKRMRQAVDCGMLMMVCKGGLNAGRNWRVCVCIR